MNEHRKPIIAIIDDEIHSDYITNLCFSLTAVEGKLYSTLPHSTCVGSHRGHGDICAAIIRHYSPCANIGSISILDSDSLSGHVQDLVMSVNWCVDHGVDIIHMSLGSIEARDYLPLFKCTKRASKAGIILVAACSNDQNISFPASFPFVIGVKKGDHLKKDEYNINPEPFSGIDYIASSYHVLNENILNHPTPICNSFAAPVITAKIANLFLDFPHIKLCVIKDCLRKDCLQSVPFSPTRKHTEAIYIHEFVRFFSSKEKECVSHEVPILMISGDNKSVNMYKELETIIFGFMKKDYMPLTLVEKGLRRPYSSKVVDSPIEAMKYQVLLSTWFGADIIIIYVLQETEMEVLSSGRYPDILICGNNSDNKELCAHIIQNGGKVYCWGNNSTRKLFRQIYCDLIKE